MRQHGLAARSILVTVWGLGANVVAGDAQTPPNVQVSDAVGDQTEPSVAVNPNDSRHIIVGAIDVPTNGCRHFASFDGGATWSTGLLPTGDRTRCTDPSVAFNSSGEAFFAGLFYDGNFVVTRIGLARSTDGGVSYENPLLFDDPWNTCQFCSPGAYKVDKPYMAIDVSGGTSDGWIHLVWNTVQSSVDDTCGDVDGDGNRETCSRSIRVATSVNDGAGVGGAGFVSQSLGATNNYGAHVAVGPEGERYIGWRMFHARQSDGTWIPLDRIVVSGPGTSGWSVVAELGEQDPGADVQGTWRTTRYPALSVAHGGARAGDAYVVYADDPPAFGSLTPPSGNEAYPMGVNTAGTVVGYELVPPDRFVAFQRRLGAWMRIEVPDATSTFASDVSDDGRVVGYARDDAGQFRGFMMDGDGFSTSPGQLSVAAIEPPGAVSTTPLGIADDGSIAGSYVDASGTRHGFLLEGSAYSILDAPGAVATEARDVTNDGTVVGHYEDTGGTQHGFLYRSGVWTTVDHPGAVATWLYGINEWSEMIGTYLDGGGATRGFLVRDGSFVALDPTAATRTELRGISNAGEVVGHARLASGSHEPFRSSGAPSQDIWVARSGDGAATWSEPVRVNDRVFGDQFDPWICTSSDGIVHVAWLDRRDDPSNFSYRLYYARSNDGASTFGPNQRIATVPSDPRNAELLDNGNGFVGDYLGMACAERAMALPVWPDLREGAADQDIFMASLDCGLADHGNGTVSDECTHLLWVQDAGLAATSGADPDGLMTWTDALGWVETLSVGGYDDWRLPRTLHPDHNCDPGATPMIGVSCIGSELGQLYYARGITGTSPSPFSGVVSGTYYWTRTVFNVSRAWVFGFSHGEMGSGNASPAIELPAWAVRDARPGDTNPGTDRWVSPHPDVRVTFETVTDPGITTVVASEEDPGPGGANISFLGTFFDVSTTATWSGAVTICISYDESDVPTGTDETDLTLYHLENGVWAPVPTSVDTVNNRACATVATLSWFGIGEEAPRRLRWIPIILVLIALGFWYVVRRAYRMRRA